MLEIENLSDKDALFYFKDGLKDWAETELDRRNVQTLDDAITASESLVDYSSKNKKPNLGKSGGDKNVQKKGYDLKDGGNKKSFSIKYKQGSGTIKAINSEAKPIIRIAEAVKVKIRDWQGELDFTVIPMDDFKVVLGHAFFCKSYTFPIPTVNSLVILDAKTIRVIPLRRMEKAKPLLSAMQFKKGLKKDECYVATLRELTDEGNTTCHKESLPSCILEVLDEYRDVMPTKLPKKLPPRREVDHQIELELGAKPPTMILYWMAPSELVELRRQLQDLLDSGYIQPSKAPYGAPVLFQKKKDSSLQIITLDEHVQHLKQVFQVLRDNELYIKLEKCSFAQQEVEFFGHKIKDGKLMMDHAKVQAIQEWQPPTKVPELRSFIGLENYYCRSIKGYSAITSPLTELLKKDKAWHRWSVMQDEHPITYESRKLNDTKKNYTIQEKEMTAIIHCLRIWRHYLLGSKFVIMTDNVATSYFQTQKKLSPNQARWQDFLAKFDYELQYKTGKANVVADALSRKDELATLLAHPIDDIEAYVRTCLVCQQDKVEQQHPVGLLEPLPIAKRPWESVFMDFIVALPKSKGYGSIMVVVDRFSKYAMFIPAQADCKVDEAAHLFFKHVVKLWGIPRSIVSDCDPRFIGKFWRELFKLMGTDLNFSTSFHPQSDGQTERINALLELYLQHYVSAYQRDWAKLLDMAQFSYNLQRSEFGKSPFEIVMGQQPLTPHVLVTPYVGDNPAAFRFAKEWQEEADITLACLDKVAYKMKKWADTKRRPLEFQVGDMVLLKLLPNQFKSLRKVHKRLKYNGDEEVPSRNISTCTPTAVITEYDKEVEKILSHRVIRKRGVPPCTEYFVK
ncbi:hypothetical protein L6164_016743 [Bauhinia variegata]|uniref:Uncharacterized protein n=1 Tax=Bauhinia variegata TaxID=167791 RepID=A0ACB9N6U5_BAUVA|nr:hypothetical protein L6164_016743 [Bauhinia variegata]